MRRIGWAFVLATLVAATPAKAAFYSFTFTQTSIVKGMSNGNVSGAFDVDATNVIVGIAGSTTVLGSITGLLAPDTLGQNDNRLLLPPGPSFFNFNGVSFSTAARNLNLYFSGGVYRLNDLAGNSTLGTFTLTACTAGSLAACAGIAVPEPATIAVLAAALLGLGVVRRRRRRIA